MDKRLILAVAGSGKTYSICNYLDENSRNIIIAYTNQNIRNIENELMKRFGFIPTETKVITFHAFMLRYLIKPYEIDIAKYYGTESYRSKGVSFSNPPPASFVSGKYRRANPNYNKDDTLMHYMHGQKYYSSLLSKLIMKTSNRKYKLCKEAMKNISNYVDQIYIDEFQDFRNYDYKLIKEIIKFSNRILLVGDFYQHSVSGTNNSGMPFDNVEYKDYIDNMKKLKLEVDLVSHIKSRRCSKKTCDFVRNKLNINIEHHDENDTESEIIMLKDLAKIKAVIHDDNYVKLVYQKSNCYNINCINWGYSKGDTYTDICIILTDKTSNLCEDTFEVSSISEQIRNKLYVAITRAKSNVFFVDGKDFKKIIEL